MQVRSTIKPAAVIEPLGTVRSFWVGLRQESLSLYCVLGYLVFEYGRPQQIYEWLDIFPFSAGFLAMSVILGLREKPGIYLNVGATLWLALFTVLVLLSSMAAYSPSLAFSNFYIFLNWLLVYISFVTILQTPRRWMLAFLFFLLLSFKMSQHGLRTWVSRGLSFADWGLGGPPGWFENSGELGIQMCVFLPLAIAFVLAFKQHWSRIVRAVAWLMPVTAIATILGSSSRGAVLGGFAAMIPLALRSKYKWKALGGVIVVVLIGYLIMPPEFMERFHGAGEDHTSQTRLLRWKGGMDMMWNHPLLGVGYFNWPVYFPQVYDTGERGAQLAHNIFVQVGAELGLTGMLLFIVMIFGCLKMTRRIRRAAKSDPAIGYYEHLANGLDGALLGYLVSGFFVTVFFYPYFWVQLAFTVSLYNIVRLNTNLPKVGAYPRSRGGSARASIVRGHIKTLGT